MNGRNLAAYRNSKELSNGSLLEIFFTTRHHPGTWFDPPEDDRSDPEIRIDGVATSWKNLPGEVTPEVIEELAADAEEDTRYDFGFPDEDCGTEQSGLF